MAPLLSPPPHLGLAGELTLPSGDRDPIVTGEEGLRDSFVPLISCRPWNPLNTDLINSARQMSDPGKEARSAELPRLLGQIKAVNGG